MIESGLKSILTLDLGGTNIKAALVTPEGRLEYFGSYATLAERGPAKLIDRIHCNKK
jgi:predicted NBD/HSP70 family sugar kinase